MTNFEIISTLLHQHIERLSLSADTIADVCNTAAVQIANAITSEQKVFSAGTGIDGSAALCFRQLIREGIWLERPALPIINLTAINTINTDSGAAWIAQELNSLGQPNDVAVIWGSQLSPANVEMINAATDQRRMHVIWIGTQGPTMSLSFDDADAQVRASLSYITALAMARIVESHLFST